MSLGKSIAIVVVIIIVAVFVYENKGRDTITAVTTDPTGEYKNAYFAGGCFWCVESDFEKIPEVMEVVSGFMGGQKEDPKYDEVAGGLTYHRETAKIIYNPEKTSYEALVWHYFRHIDPTDAEGSFFDRGRQYSPAIYYENEEEKTIAEKVIKKLGEEKVYDKPIVVAIEPAGEFYQAADYHQDFHEKNGLRYKAYRKGSGRDAYLESIWGDGEHDELLRSATIQPASSLENKGAVWLNFVKPSDAELKKILTDIQYEVTQHEGTERAYQNEYFDNHEEGIYVDVVSGEPLFSSTDKFDSGTGWPSFLKPIDYDFVTEHEDRKLFTIRTEIRSKIADSHLGHIILDGPESNDKIRYCMNSAAMRFVPKADMEREGYGEFLNLFN